MRARTVAVGAAALGAAAIVVAGVVLVAGPAPRGPERERAEPYAVPQDLTWQYASSCTNTLTSGETSPACPSSYRFEERASGFTYVDAFERAQLWDYYNAVTEPCIESRGIALPPLTRAQFFVPDSRPWNPYTALDDLPFDELLALYHACPPVPEYLRDRHEP